MSWEPKVGDVIYTAGESHREEVWDDTELIEHWETAMAKYRSTQGITNNLPPFTSSHKEEKTTTNTTEKRPHKKLKQDITNNKKGHVEMNTSTTATIQQSLSVHPPPVPPLSLLSHHPQVSGNDSNNKNDFNETDTDFSNLLMSWYYSGYYTGYYQGSR
ncbi:hypothetical protein BDA99DRAFT_86992 [Phascolomyces articulosus]|uniref:Survival Motor Neuron Gemin2-binding domain-containing protein n=1 Tax=Phascolomyces articulosus TaxID=60185 RepID=A0AAD5K8W1_9FUNG|nr:hypothetical protein BDA99DRAFT_86992 [Phascolomyces articulosus]